MGQVQGIGVTLTGMIAMDTDKLCREMINLLFYTSPSLQSKVRQSSQQKPRPVPIFSVIFALFLLRTPTVRCRCCFTHVAYLLLFGVKVDGLVLSTETRLSYSHHCWKWAICPFQWSISKYPLIFVSHCLPELVKC